MRIKQPILGSGRHLLTSTSTMAGLCQLIATVPTGLEGGAADEVQETLGRKAEATRGRINFEIASFEQLKLVTKHMDSD